jgi:hypothetical protein
MDHISTLYASLIYELIMPEQKITIQQYKTSPEFSHAITFIRHTLSKQD